MTLTEHAANELGKDNHHSLCASIGKALRAAGLAEGPWCCIFSCLGPHLLGVRHYICWQRVGSSTASKLRCVRKPMGKVLEESRVNLLHRARAGCLQMLPPLQMDAVAIFQDHILKPALFLGAIRCRGDFPSRLVDACREIRKRVYVYNLAVGVNCPFLPQ